MIGRPRAQLAAKDDDVCSSVSMSRQRLQHIHSYFEDDLAPVEKVAHPLFADRGLELYIQREDGLGKGLLSGNKFRKLKYNLIAAAEQEQETLLSFGGAFSNHIVALAAAGYHFGFKTIGLIRGEERLPLNKVLAFAKQCGMELHYLDRSTYRDKDRPEFTASLRERFGNFHLIPEGGTNAEGVRGTAETLTRTKLDFDLVCCPVGTGGTLAGILTQLKPHQKALGFSVLKNCFSLNEDVENWFAQLSTEGSPTPSWEINHDFHCGGYGKRPVYLQESMAAFEATHPILLEPIYTGKMFRALCQLAEDGAFPRGEKILAIHTWCVPPQAGNS